MTDKCFAYIFAPANPDVDDDRLLDLWEYALFGSTAGNPFAPITSGTTILETTTGALRSVEVRDLYLLSDPAHPRRFMRLHVSAP